MKYPYMTFNDETEVTHSELHKDGTVNVYFETPVFDGFHNATCALPTYKWNSIQGYSDSEIQNFTVFLHHNAHLIMEFAAEGGFEGAAAI